ncbi:MAG: SIS domain-containing protein [Anaerolineales bacterium]|nr:SIS domain-containing protein [Anaerolineales bacterium]
MYTTARQILDEIDRVLRGVDPTQVDALAQAILDAKLVIVHGLGREGLVMRSFAMRLMHLGIPVAVTGDMTTPPAGPGMLFLVACGPGYLGTVEALAGIAQRAGAKVFMVTAQPGGSLPQMADAVLVLPAQTMAEGEGSSSHQAMGSAFEQAMWILFDAVVPVLQAQRGETTEDLRKRHTNLE